MSQFEIRGERNKRVLRRRECKNEKFYEVLQAKEIVILAAQRAGAAELVAST